MMMMMMGCLPFSLVISADSFQQNRPTVQGRVFSSLFEYGWQNIVCVCVGGEWGLAVISLFFTPSPNAANQAGYYHHKGYNVID
jgi:hypothetical protein